MVHHHSPGRKGALEELPAAQRSKEHGIDKGGIQRDVLYKGQGFRSVVHIRRQQNLPVPEGQVLLGVSGQASALEAGTSAAEPLLQALEDSGADGLYLDITQRQWTDAVHLTQLAEALHRAAPEKKLYVEADAPVRGELDPDYAGLAAAADRIVLRVPAVTDSAAAVPVCAMEPLENICYALSVLNDEVPAQKLSLLLTAAGQAWNAGSRRFSTVTGDTLEAMLEEGTTYYSDRYACAYAETENGVVWYLDGRGLAARRQLLNCFGVNALCVSIPEGMLTLAES